MANSEVTPTPPSEIHPEPHSSDDFVQQGWILHVNRDLAGAEESFRTALSKDPLSYEAAYGLGLDLKLQGRKEEATQMFQKTIAIIKENPGDEDHNRRNMLQHLANAHMQMMAQNYGEALP